MSTHTSGPWKSMPEESDRPYIRVRGTTLGKRWEIANVSKPPWANVDEQEAEETRANARLIAAAPDLLEALRPFANYACKWPCDCHNCRARTAIAKATGSAA